MVDCAAPTATDCARILRGGGFLFGAAAFFFETGARPNWCSGEACRAASSVIGEVGPRVEPQKPCVVRDANTGQQSAGGNSSWCPGIGSLGPARAAGFL